MKERISKFDLTGLIDRRWGRGGKMTNDRHQAFPARGLVLPARAGLGTAGAGLGVGFCSSAIVCSLLSVHPGRAAVNRRTEPLQRSQRDFSHAQARVA